MVKLGAKLEEESGLGLGCMSVSGQYSNGVPLDEAEAIAFFKGVYDAGCRHFDTAEVYKSGPLNAPATADTVFNETQLSKFFATVPRESFTVATKYMPLLRSGKCDYESVKAALTASMERLGLSYVDLYYNHVVISCEAGVEFAASVKRLVQEGLVKNLGLSEVSAPWLRAAHTVHPVCCIQQEWSLLTRNVEETLVPTCRDLGIGLVAYSPLARNLLTAPKERPEDSRRAGIPRFSEDNFEKNRKMLLQLEELATGKGVTPAQLSLAWLVQKARDLNVSVLPIPGTAKLPHALDNLASMKVSLTPDDMKLLEEIARQTAGDRESEGYMSMRIEGQEMRAEMMKRAGSDPAVAAELITTTAEGCRSWPPDLQGWVRGLLEKEGGVQELMTALVEHHSNAEDPDPVRACPGASADFKAKVLEALPGVSFEQRLRAKFPEVQQQKATRSNCSLSGCSML